MNKKVSKGRKKMIDGRLNTPKDLSHAFKGWTVP
jgi:hypothetical protein